MPQLRLHKEDSNFLLRKSKVQLEHQLAVIRKKNGLKTNQKTVVPFLINNDRNQKN